MDDLLPYLTELRRRLIYCVSCITVIFLVLSCYATQIYHLLALPLLRKLPKGSGLIATKITATFSVPLKFSFVMSVIISAPYLLFHMWQFVAPALYTKEKKILWWWLLPSVTLFYVGVLFAYYVALPLIFKFFISITPVGVELKPDITQYLEFTLQLLFAFGWAFEVPIITVALVWFNLATIQQLTAIRPYMMLLAFILGMILTPPDVLSQCMLAIPLYVLYELGLLASRILLARSLCKP